MMYRAFAVITLIAAPIVVLFVQNAVPQQPAQPAAVAAQPAQPLESVPQRLPPVPVSSSTPQPEAAQFGQPMPDAGKPFLAPGNGLPDAPSPQVPSSQGEVGTEEIAAISDR